MTKLLELQANLVDGRTKMFRTYIMVRVESDTEEGLKSQVRSIFDGAKGYSLEPIRLRYIQLDIRESF